MAKLRSIDAQGDSFEEGVEKEVYAILRHPLMTGNRLRWEYPKDGFGKDRHDLGPPDLYVSAFFKSPPSDGIREIEELSVHRDPVKRVVGIGAPGVLTRKPLSGRVGERRHATQRRGPSAKDSAKPARARAAFRRGSDAGAHARTPHSDR